VLTLKQEYRRLCKLIHPDKCSNPRAQEATQLLTAKYDEAGSPGKVM